MLGSLALIGGGVMGEAMLKRLLDLCLLTPDHIRVAEVVPDRCRYLSDTYGVSCTPAVGDAVPGAATVALSIKPQNLPEVLDELRQTLQPGQLLLSIIAGATMQTLTVGSGHQTVVRVMPNTPAQIGQGISVWTATPEVTESQKAEAAVLLSALGPEVYVTGEHYLDMATALSGSGPAYVFLFIEALIDAGVHIGLPRETAERLTLQTVLGSAQFAQESGRHPAQLRNMVTSPGGTTTEALAVLEASGVRAALLEAVIAAHQKSLALGRPQGH